MGSVAEQTSNSPFGVTHPEWVKDAAIYQLNLRHFTQEGTFAAAQDHLPRLKALGVSIIWIMPIHEIGEMHRKGSLGSPYSVRDYYSLDSSYGTVADAQNYIAVAHALGMRVILDWVANHTAWDNPLTTLHPGWYARDWKGDLRPTPWWDWDDVVEFDYANEELRQYMINAMAYWFNDVGFDGFRCDVAGFVPTDFWVDARRALMKIKPIFLLAEWEDQSLHESAFDMTYAWTWERAIRRIKESADRRQDRQFRRLRSLQPQPQHAVGRQTRLGVVPPDDDVSELRVYYSWNEKAYPANSIRMTFVSNHDKNAWEGTQFELFGDSLEAAMVLSVIGEGMPLIFNGQEVGNQKRLKLFEKDAIRWGDGKHEHSHGILYRHLIKLKKESSCLWNGAWGARMIEVPADQRESVLSFVRRDDNSKVFLTTNLSEEDRTVRFRDSADSGSRPDPHHGAYRVFTAGIGLTDVVIEVSNGYEARLPAWGYQLLVAVGQGVA